jgi:hypothetical protein
MSGTFMVSLLLITLFAAIYYQVTHRMITDDLLLLVLALSTTIFTAI